VAWVSPEDGGNTIAFAHREGGDWRHVLFIESPDAVRARPTRYGCPVLFPFPGYTREARYLWDGEVRDLPINAPDGRSHVHGFAHDRPWQVVEHRENVATLELATRDALTAEERRAYPFDFVARQTVSVSDRALEIAIEAENRGTSAAPAGLGLHPYIDPNVLGTDRTGIKVSLPGTRERELDGPVPTGGLRAATTQECGLADGGTLLCRTGLGDEETVSLRGRGERAAQINLWGHWSDVVLFVPSDQPSVAIEPLTCALSAASLAPDSPGRLPSLAPGDRVLGGIRLHLSP
jgi:galactose mutarotase-like enzyme